MKPPNTLLLPGWQNSGPDHWQSRWERLHGYHRVEQHDWMRPLRGDWSARLEETVADADGPVVLVAHSLGCILTAWWAAIRATRPRCAARCWWPRAMWSGLIWPRRSTAGRPLRASRCRFPAVLVGSRNDPYCSLERAEAWPAGLGRALCRRGERGHINAESGLGDWAEGHGCCTLQD
jgi:predicted alpha/beta hydrolase family esterase